VKTATQQLYKYRDTHLIWQALGLITSAAKKGPVTLNVDPKDLDDMKGLLERMSDHVLLRAAA
jgi:hypothetical protein